MNKNKWFLTPCFSRFGLLVFSSFTFIWGSFADKWWFVIVLPLSMFLAYLIDKHYGRKNTSRK